MTCSSSQDLSTVSTCLWQSLESLHQTDGNRHDRGLTGSLKRQGPKSRHRHSACCVGQYVYLFGGKEGTSPLKDVWRFHIDSCKWEAVELLGTGLPFLQGHTSVAYKKLVLIFGGTFSDSVGDAQLWTFDTDSGQVEEKRLKAGSAQPSCRRDHSAVVHNSTMYVYGGFVGSRGANQEMWVLNIEEMKWTQLRALSAAHPGGRYSHSAVVADNAMWLFGGMAGLQPKSDLWRYSFLLHQWKKVKALGSPPCLSGHAASVVSRHMVVVGGKCQGRPISDVWCFSFDTSTWQQVSQLDRLPCLSFHACVSYCPDQPPTETSMKGISYGPPLESPDSCPKDMTPGTCSSPSLDTERNQSSFQSGQCGREVAQVKGTGDSGMEETPSANNCKKTDFDMNSSVSTDTCIHVSLTEALIPAASSEAASHSFKPFSKKASRYVQLKEEQMQESSAPSTDHSVLLMQSSKSSPGQTDLQASPMCESQKPVTISQKSIPDLIDFSESVVLKGPSVENDLLFEELDLLGLKNPDGVLTSCPSTTYALRPHQLWSKDVGDLPSHNVLPVYSQWNPYPCPFQAASCNNWCPPCHHHQSGDQEIELEPVLPQSPATKVSDLHTSPEEYQVEQDSPYPTHCKQEPEKSFSQTGHPELQHWSTPSPSVTEQWKKFCPPLNQGDGDTWEIDTSFTENETGDDVLLIRSETDTGAESQTTPDLASPMSVETVLLGSANGKKLRKSKDGGSGRRERRKEQTVCALKASEFGGECMLVLGGHSQELMSRPCRPMPVWKGVLL